MSEEYEYGPWIETPEGGSIVIEREGYPLWYSGRFRIATPKPKRELVVGKWYRTCAGWRVCIAITKEGAWLAYTGGCPVAHVWSVDRIDWSVPPRDTAPEGQS